MRGQFLIEGFNSDMSEGGDLFKREKFQVDFTKDSRGATLSIGSFVDQKQYTIPIDFLIKELKKGGHL